MRQLSQVAATVAETMVDNRLIRTLQEQQAVIEAQQAEIDKLRGDLDSVAKLAQRTEELAIRLARAEERLDAKPQPATVARR